MSDLTKWPRLIVVGEPVTREQANDVLIRTNSACLWANDKPWMRQVATEFGIALDEHGEPEWRSQKTVYESLGCLDLSYMSNMRVMSTWIGGPYGWCDWDGRIGCSTYNVGKWPTVEDVTGDWQAIAREWPFLTLDAQLIADEGEGEVAAQWQIQGGIAEEAEPGVLLTEPAELSEGQIIGRVFHPRGERGVSLERLREALTQVRAQRQGGSDG